MYATVSAVAPITCHRALHHAGEEFVLRRPFGLIRGGASDSVATRGAAAMTFEPSRTASADENPTACPELQALNRNIHLY